MEPSEDRQDALPEDAAAPPARVGSPCPIVGLGASAGGFEAFQAFLSGMPADNGMAFVLVQHLDPRHETLMPELLAKHTEMPVRLVVDEMAVEVNGVYVIPPNATLTIDDCKLRVTRQDRARGRRSPIDSFFRSLAEDQGDEAVGILLSGTGTDGALGLRAIKEHGGLALVQAPDTARHGSMPRAAVLTGVADAVLPVEEMPARLLEHRRSLTSVRGGADELRAELERQVVTICSLLRRMTGQDFSRYKRSTLIRRIRRRVTELQAKSVDAYVERLRADPQEVDQLFHDLLISVTHFFRDAEAFAALARRVIPKLFEGKGPDAQIRVWVPGCATGEEAYSLAILLSEQRLLCAEPPQVQVFATDIDTKALEVARQALYPERIAEQMPAGRLARFFLKHGNMFQVTKEVRELCLFSTHNLIADPPFSRLDLLSCRNLLIYLEADLQKKLVPLCHYALRSGGYLFLGPSESVESWPELFRAVDRRHRIFQAREVVPWPQVSFPLAERSRHALARLQSEEPAAVVGAAAEEEGSAERSAVVQRLESELRSTKDHLQATLEELESSNEELTSSNEELSAINEELQSTNEELQTSKEELQSVNEELETINTELKKKIDELDRASSDLLNLFQSTQIATLFVDRSLHIQRFTPSATDVFRLLDGDVGRLLDDIAPRFTGGDDLRADIRSVLRTLSVRERQVRLIDEDAWYILRILPYRTIDNVIDGVVMTFVDITELRQAQDQRTQLARIVESSQDAILGKTLDGTVTSWNAGAEKMYGYTAQEAIGRSIDLVVPADRRHELGPIFDHLRAGRAVAPFETVRLHKDGRRLEVLLTVSPMRDASGVVTGASAIARDITDRKRAEAALHEAVRRRDEFLAMLGHELRNPLAPIRNCLYVLAMPNTTAAQAEQARATLERQVAHLTRLVDDLLDVSRISNGKILLQKETLDLVELVRAAVDDHRASLLATGLELETQLPAEPMWVHGDPTRLAQVIGNVLHNAGKFSDRGGRVTVEMRAEGRRAVVAVRDTGIGIAPQVLADLFEPFSQAPPGLDRSRGGLGLGLTLVHRLVELHGGLVEAASEGLGRGAEFRLLVPLEGGAKRSPSPRRGERRQRRCLIIEDNVDAAESLGLLLQLDGHEVSLAYDGAEGLAAARRLRPEIVLCDIGLPGGLDGYAVARAVHADPELADVRLIALTGYGQDEDQRLSREAGFDVHLTKPADLEALRRLLVEL